MDGRGNAGNWMALVNSARYAQEQNLTALQEDGEIFYEACKDIAQVREKCRRVDGEGQKERGRWKEVDGDGER